MVTTNDKIIIWWLTNRKHKKPFWLDTSLLPWWKKVMYPTKWCSHKWRHTYKNDQKISSDPFYWVVYLELLIICLESISSYRIKLFSPKSYRPIVPQHRSRLGKGYSQWTLIQLHQPEYFANLVLKTLIYCRERGAYIIQMFPVPLKWGSISKYELLTYPCEILFIYFTSLDIVKSWTGAVMEIQKLKTVIKRCAYPDPCQQ